MNEYNMLLRDLFGKRCKIPHVLNKQDGFIYRIVSSGMRSNCWAEPPLGRFGSETPINHGQHVEDVLIVVCDTLIDEKSKLVRVALKDVEIMDE